MGRLFVWAPNSTRGCSVFWWIYDSESTSSRRDAGESFTPYVLRSTAGSPQPDRFEYVMPSTMARGYVSCEDERMQGTPWSEEFDGEVLHEVAWWRQRSKAERIRCFLHTVTRKTLINHSARVETQNMSLALSANPEARERAKDQAGRIQNSRTGSALVCLRRNTQHLELKFPESRRIVLNTVVIVFVFTCGPIGCPVSPPLLSS